jgi:hypothetical protein
VTFHYFLPPRGGPCFYANLRRLAHAQTADDREVAIAALPGKLGATKQAHLPARSALPVLFLSWLLSWRMCQRTAVIEGQVWVDADFVVVVPAANEARQTQALLCDLR